MKIHMGFILELQKILLVMYANIIVGTPITQHTASAVIFDKLQDVFYFLSVSIYFTYVISFNYFISYPSSIILLYDSAFAFDQFSSHQTESTKIKKKKK